MRFPLTRERAEALYNVLTLLMDDYKPENMAESLISDIMKGIYEKLRRKIVGSYVKEYALTLSPTEAKAYWIFFSQVSIDPAMLYERNLIQAQCAEIDKVYG